MVKHLLSHEGPAKTIALPAYQLTRLGREVMQLGSYEPHLDYLRRVGQAIVRQGFEVLLADYRRTSETTIKYFDREKL
jgi:hypothetical protein